MPHEFYLGVYPVTQGQWQAVMGSNPSWFSRTGGGKGKVKKIAAADLKQFPVESISAAETAFLAILGATAA
jgi:formylglycine-generating enzyme required for sulfatase activity